MLKAHRIEIIKQWNPWHCLSRAPPVLHFGVIQPLCSCQAPPQDGGDLKEETTKANAQTDSSRKGPLCGFSFLPQPVRCKFEPPRARKYVSQCWWSPQCFWNPIVTHGLEQLDTTTGEAFWKAVSLAHNIGLTLPEKSMVKLTVILMREEVGQYWKISCTAFIFCHWFLVIPRERAIILNLHQQSRQVLLPKLGFCSLCRKALYSIKLSCDTCYKWQMLCCFPVFQTSSLKQVLF